MNVIRPEKGTLGVRRMPDKLDSNTCHLRCGKPAVVRINLDGIYTSLCEPHRAAFFEAFIEPLRSPLEEP
jgi:hypothetical protein